MTHPSSSAGQHPPGVHLLPTTHWSVVLSAAWGASPQADQALEELCRAYWFPLYSYIRRHGYEAAEAQDLTQEFFSRLLHEQGLAQVAPAKGKFRSFLLAALNHFLANEWHRLHASKRGGGHRILPLDEGAEKRYAVELASDLTPEKLYERHWAQTLFERALDRLRQQYVAAGKTGQYDCLNEFLSREPRDAEYHRAGAQLGLTPGAVSTAVHRLRQRYRQLVREEIAHTVSSPAEVQDEARSLLRALS